MTIVFWLVERAQFVMVVMAATLLLVGVPRVITRYRILAAVFSLLSIGVALQWYAYYVISALESREEAHWPYLAVSVLFTVASAAFVVELFSLRALRRLNKKAVRDYRT